MDHASRYGPRGWGQLYLSATPCQGEPAAVNADGDLGPEFLIIFESSIARLEERDTKTPVVTNYSNPFLHFHSASSLGCGRIIPPSMTLPGPVSEKVIIKVSGFVFLTTRCQSSESSRII